MSSSLVPLKTHRVGALDVGLACFQDGVSLLVDMEGDSGRGELLVSAVLEKSSPNSCKQTRSSSAIGRQESVSENSIRCAWCRVCNLENRDGN
ncbi:hypothetical protein TNCV_1008961 [Trichonephila clavipes]|nr:hypothetical protein TNCV_1008961 [Trichonephila clavipes]